MMKKILMVAALAATVIAAGCRTAGMDADALAILDPRSGSEAQGTVQFEELENGWVSVRVDVTGVQPNAKLGFHVHENGDCSSADASSAGGHFNPMGAPHGAPTDANKHTGDFGNLTSDSRGEIHQEFTINFISLGEGTNSVLDRAVVLHGGIDDLTTQPSGNAGGRIACGVIRERL